MIRIWNANGWRADGGVHAKGEQVVKEEKSEFYWAINRRIMSERNNSTMAEWMDADCR